ncbi:MAG: hypothetical protein ACTHJ7_05540 [Candidatus Nitrosocosmicus sp.]
MDRRIKFGNFILIFVAILIFAIDSYHATTIYATKDGDSSGSSEMAKYSSFDSILPIPLPLPFDSHIADVLKNIHQPIYSNDIIPFP